MPEEMFIEFWWRCVCPKCKASNWLYDTHSQRSHSSHDLFVLECWKCGKCSWTYDLAKEEAKIMYGRIKMADIATKGKESP